MGAGDAGAGVRVESADSLLRVAVALTGMLGHQRLAVTALDW
jgi:hypothetical protein